MHLEDATSAGIATWPDAGAVSDDETLLDPRHEGLIDVVRAAQAPPRAEEFAGEDAARAAFRSATATWNNRHGRHRRHVARVAVATTALSGLLVGSAGLAAAASLLPSGATSVVVHLFRHVGVDVAPETTPASVVTPPSVRLHPTGGQTLVTNGGRKSSTGGSSPSAATAAPGAPAGKDCRSDATPANASDPVDHYVASIAGCNHAAPSTPAASAPAGKNPGTPGPPAGHGGGGGGGGGHGTPNPGGGPPPDPGQGGGPPPDPGQGGGPPPGGGKGGGKHHHHGGHHGGGTTTTTTTTTTPSTTTPPTTVAPTTTTSLP